MLKIIVFILFVTSLSSKPTNRCVFNKLGNDQCQSDVCFSHYYTLPEGDLERFDCAEESNKLNKSSCLEVLRTTKQAAVCLETANETHCCCLSTLPTRVCAADFRKTGQLTQLWTTEQILYLVFGHFSLLIVVSSLLCFYKLSVRIWPIDNVTVSESSWLGYILLGKAVFLLLSFIVIYLPFRKTCSSHPKGIFVTPRLFLYQIFDFGIAPSLYFSFPLTFFVFEFAFYWTVKTSRTINKSGGLAMAVFKMLTTPLFVYETFISTFTLWSKEHQQGYCTFTGAMWQLLSSHVFILVYHVLLVFQIVILCRMKRDVDESQRSSETTSNHVATLMSTQTVETQIESDFSEMVYIYPRPFHVPRLGLSVLNVKNNRKEDWLALRSLLSTTGFYKLYPARFLIPPGKEISIEVEQCTRAGSPTAQHNLLIEWFSLGVNPPSVDSQRLWSKPYLVPQNMWQYFVLPIYVDESDDSQASNQLFSVEYTNE